VIAAHTLPLGSTDEGKTWCLKALHPSDPLTEVRGIPDESAFPSVFMNYQSVFKIAPSVGAAGVWSFDAQLIPHPIGFMAVQATDSAHAGNSLVSEYMNSQVAGATHAAKYYNWCQTFTRWRLAYCSATVYQDAPELSDQGTMCVCQAPVQPFLLNVYNSSGLGGGPDYMLPHAMGFLTTDLPAYATSQTMPNSYFNQSKYGCYVPLKLTKTHQNWRSVSDSLYNCAGDVNDAGGTYLGPTCPTALLAAGAPVYHGTGGTWPFFTLAPVQKPAAASSAVDGDTTSPYCNDVFANISAVNLSVTTTFSVYVRYGFECQVAPGTVMTPQQKLSPLYDAEAIKAYFLISRELKDAYPSDYNDLGKILSVISSIARSVAPILSAIPHPISQAIGAFAGALPGLMGTDRQVEKVASTKSQMKEASAAEVEAGKELVARARSAAPKQARIVVPKKKVRFPKRRAPTKARQAQLLSFTQ
jgi:hypothetical protein